MTALTMTISLCLKWTLMVLHMEEKDVSSESVTMQLVFTALSEMVGLSLYLLQFAVALSLSLSLSPLPWPSRSPALPSSQGSLEMGLVVVCTVQWIADNQPQ
jgi:hypothetical protein